MSTASRPAPDRAEDPAQRSRIMRAVRGKDTAPELAVRRLLHAAGYRYRLHGADLPGRPDLVFRGRRKAVFVHGCFWHGHNCARGARAPKANADYWRAKIVRNAERDARALSALAGMRWGALVVWECETHPQRREALMTRLREFLDG